jgi:hypothetical protein
MSNILPISDIPRQLWNDNMIYIPDCLVDSYQNLLDEYGITKLAYELVNPTGEPIGGSTREETLDYFARRYGVSICRVESLVIDPSRVFTSLSDDLLSIFSEGKIALLDIACGPGSVGASLLTTLYVLRKEQKMPKTPMMIKIVGGDCSTYALDIYQKTLKCIKDTLKTVGIEVELQSNPWNAEASYATSELLDIFFTQNPDMDEYIVFIANFSGAMNKHFDEYRDSIQHIFDRMHNKRCTIIWIEPGQMNTARKFLSKIVSMIDRPPWNQTQQIGTIEHQYNWYHPFQRRSLPCRVLLRAYERR